MIINLINEQKTFLTDQFMCYSTYTSYKKYTLLQYVQDK